MKLSEVELAKFYVEQVDKNVDYRRFAIPPHLFHVFLGKEGHYPFFVILKEVLSKMGIDTND